MTGSLPHRRVSPEHVPLRSRAPKVSDDDSAPHDLEAVLSQPRPSQPRPATTRSSQLLAASPSPNSSSISDAFPSQEDVVVNAPLPPSISTLAPRSVSVSVFPSDLFKSAISHRVNAWRSLPQHLLPLWLGLLHSLFDPQLTPELNEAILLLAPILFLNREDAPNTQQLDIHLSCRQPAPRTMAFSEPSREQTILKAQKLIGLRAERKALQVLEQLEEKHDVVVPVGDAERVQLQSLFPCRKTPFDQLPSPPPIRIPRPRIVDLLIHHISRGVAPSFDGWTRELLPLFSSSIEHADPGDTILSLIHKLVNNNISPELSHFFHHGVLIALRKPNAKLRPIVISSLFLKLSWRAVLATIPTDSLLHPSQFRGKYFCQRAIVKVQHLLDAGYSVVSLDASNAFGEIKRSVIRDALASSTDLASLAPMFNMLYSRACFAVSSSGQVCVVDEGVLQGDAASPLFFSLGVRAALQAAALPSPTIVIAIADDIIVATKSADTLVASTSSLVAALGVAGVPINMTKTVTIGPHPHPDFPVVTVLDYLGGLPSTESTPVTLSDLRPFYAKRLRLISLATKPSPSHPVLARQHLNLLMRYVNYTFHYIFSVLPPARSSMLATQLDDWQRGLVTTALLPNIPLTDENFCQLGLLDDDGGDCLYSWPHLAPPLFAETHRLASRDVPDNVNDCFKVVRLSVWELAKQFWARFKVPPKRVPPASLPLYERKGRSNLHTVFNKSRIHWNAIYPSSTECILDDDQWTSSMIIRLRLDAAVSLLPCASSPHTSPIDHIMCCASCARPAWTRRHQRILFAIVRACRFHGIYASTTDITRVWRMTRAQMLLSSTTSNPLLLTCPSLINHLRPHQTLRLSVPTKRKRSMRRSRKKCIGRFFLWFSRVNAILRPRPSMHSNSSPLPVRSRV
jgi:hypothetical protein